MRLLICAMGLLGVVILTMSAHAQTTATLAGTERAIVGHAEHTEAELLDYGFTARDLENYRARMTTRAGRWWGHLSPMEMMMYSAETADERHRFARMYLQTLHPKSLAERDAGVVMYQEARALYQEQRGMVRFSNSALMEQIRPALFVRFDCESCKQDVIELIAASDTKVDVYLTGIDSEKDVNAQLIAWARSMQLPPQKVTLNDDRGIYQRQFGQPLERLQLVTQ